MRHRAPYIELHCGSAFSFLRGGSSIEAIVARAAEIGMPALALTDYMTLAEVVHFQAACAKHDIQSIVGAELAIADPIFGDAAAPAQLVVLAENAVGYARLCQLLTHANLKYSAAHTRHPDKQAILFSALAAEPEGLIVLTGGVQGALARLLISRHYEEALTIARRYYDAFGPDRVFIELQHHRLPESTYLMQELARLAADAGLRVVATNNVRFATRREYSTYDLLTCVRLGISVDSPHAARPRND